MSARAPFIENPQFSSETLNVVLEEVSRARSLQSQRINNLQSRAGVLVGASGLAAGLISSLSTNLWLIAPMVALFLSALLGILAIAPRSGYGVDPRRVFVDANGKPSREATANVISGIVSEYELQESKLEWPAVFLKAGTLILVCAIGLLVVAALGGTLVGDSTKPIQVEIVEESNAS